MIRHATRAPFPDGARPLAAMVAVLVAVQRLLALAPVLAPLVVSRRQGTALLPPAALGPGRLQAAARQQSELAPV